MIEPRPDSAQQLQDIQNPLKKKAIHVHKLISQDPQSQVAKTTAGGLTSQNSMVLQ